MIHAVRSVASDCLLMPFQLMHGGEESQGLPFVVVLSVLEQSN